MQKLPTALAISAAVHVIVVVCAQAYDGEGLAATLPAGTARPIVVELVEPALPTEPLAVALVPDSIIGTSDPVVATAALTRPAHTRDTVRVRPPDLGSGPMSGTRVNEDPLRPDARAYDLRLRPERAEEIANAIPSDPSRAVPSSGVLQPAGAGTRSDQGAFTMDVDPSGDAKLTDKRNLQVSIPTPKQILKAAGRGIADWYENPNKIPDGKEVESGKDTKPDHGQTVPIVGGSFDLTDAFMRRKGQDPYFSKKLRVLDSTRDERAEIGGRHRKRQLARSTELVHKQLVTLWSSTGDLATRKQALFELWDDCAESGDAAIVEGGRAARKLVLGFIRSRLPAGSPTAFTAAELATLNRAKQSVATFAPYE